MIHGSASAYVYHKCRCDVCRAGSSARARERNKLKAYGRFETVFVDAGPVREHLLELNKLGWGVVTIAERAGTPRTVTRQLVYGRSPAEINETKYPKPKYLTKVRRETAEKLLALTFEAADGQDGTQIDGKGTRRRIQALAVAGYSLHWQAKQLGWELSNYTLILTRDRVQVSTYKLVRDLFETYEMVEPVGVTHQDRGGITRAKNRAKALGWLPAAAWDDIDRDATPPVFVEQLKPGARGTRIVDDVVVDALMRGLDVNLPYGTALGYATEMFRRGATQMQVLKVIPLNRSRLKEAKMLAEEGKNND
jgi:hypothetical protein